MPISLIHQDFLDAWTQSPTWESLKQGYVEPHMEILQVYHANFSSWQAQDPAAVLRDFQKRWGLEPDRTAQLAEKLRGVPLSSLMHRGYDAANQVLQPKQGPDAVCMIGLSTSNAFQMVVGGRTTIAIAAEVFGQTLMGILPMPYEDIPLWLAHEFAHAVRTAESDTLKAQLERQHFDMAATAVKVPLLEILIDEGLAVQTSAAVAPEARPTQVLGFPDADLAWCEQNWDRLWGELEPKLHAPPGTDGYLRYFGFAAKDIPPRAGYYVGWKLVRAHLERNPGLTLAEAVRLPAPRFIV